MAVENFITYTEVDSGDDITVTATKCDVDTMQRLAVSYVYKSHGAAHFGNFEHLLTYFSGTNSANGAQAGIWLVGATFGTHIDHTNSDDAMSVYIYRDSSTGVKSIKLRDYTNDNTDPYVAADSTLFYLTIKRADTTLTCKIYTDSERTALTDILALICTNATYEYVQPCFSAEIIGSHTWTFYTENLDLQEVGAVTSYLSPSDDANASDNIIFNAGKNLSDNAKASDNVSFWTGRLHNIGDTAKAADSIVFNAGRKPSDNPKANDGLAFNAGWHTSDNPKSSDGVAVNAGIPIADNPKSNDGIVFNAGKNLSDNPKASDTLIHAVSVFLSDTAKAADTIAFNVGKILSDTAKAIDRIAYVPPMIVRNLLRRPLRAIRDYRQKYTKQDMEKEKYHVSKKEDFKYKVEKKGV